MKLRIFILLTFLFVIVGAASILNSVNNAAKRQFEDATRINLRLQTVALATTLDYVFTDYIKDMNFVASRLKTRRLDSAAGMRIAYDYLFNSNRYVINVCYLNKEGILEYIYPKKYSGAIGNDYSFREYFKKAKKTNKLVISMPVDNYRPQKTNVEYKSINLLLPVLDKIGKKKGYFAMGIDVDSLSHLVELDRNIEGDSKTSYYLVDTEKKEFLCSPAPSAEQDPVSNSEAFIDFLLQFSHGREQRCALTSFDKKKMYVSSNYVNFRDSSLMIFATLPYTESIDSFANFAREMSLIIIFFLLTLILIAIIVISNRTIVKSLERKFDDLKIVVDEKIKKQDIEEITESEFFKDLSEKVASHKKNS